VIILELIYVGYTTMTHGIKGELKFYTNFSLKKRILKPDFPIYILDKPYTITSARPHQNHYLITINHLNDINLVENFRNQKIYIDRENLHLSSHEVLVEELIGYMVFDEKEMIGKVIDIMYNNGGILLCVKKDKKFYIPYNEFFVKNVIKQENKIFVSNVGGLML